MEREAASSIPSTRYDSPEDGKGYTDDSDSRKGAWSAQEDQLLLDQIQAIGVDNWSEVAKGVEGRNGKSCRLRWHNQLNPDLRHTPFTPEEDAVIIEAHQSIGNRWSRISKLLQGRTDNAVKNRWNSSLSKRVHARSKHGRPLSRVVSSSISKQTPSPDIMRYRGLARRHLSSPESTMEGLERMDFTASPENHRSLSPYRGDQPGDSTIRSLRFRDTPEELELDGSVQTSAAFWRKHDTSRPPPPFPLFPSTIENTWRTRPQQDMPLKQGSRRGIFSDTQLHHSSPVSHMPLDPLSPGMSNSSRHSLGGHLDSAFLTTYDDRPNASWTGGRPSGMQHLGGHRSPVPWHGRSGMQTGPPDDACSNETMFPKRAQTVSPHLSPMRTFSALGLSPVRMGSEPSSNGYMSPFPLPQMSPSIEAGDKRTTHVSPRPAGYGLTPDSFGSFTPMLTHHHSMPSSGDLHPTLHPTRSAPEVDNLGLMADKPSDLLLHTISPSPQAPMDTLQNLDFPNTSQVMIGGECMPAAPVDGFGQLDGEAGASPWDRPRDWTVASPESHSKSPSVDHIADMQPEDVAELENLVMDLLGPDLPGSGSGPASRCASAVGNAQATSGLYVTL